MTSNLLEALFHMSIAGVPQTHSMHWKINKVQLGDRAPAKQILEEWELKSRETETEM